MGLVNVKNSSTSLIKPKFGIFNPDLASYSNRGRNKTGIWRTNDVYEQQENNFWPFGQSRVQVKNQILASSPVYNSVSAEKCASTVKLSSDVFCLVYASSNTIINYQVFSIRKGFSLSDGGLIRSEQLGAITTLVEPAARVSEISSSFDEVSGRILLSITYGYGTGGDISGGSQIMTSRSVTKIIIGKYNSSLKTVSWSVVNNLYDSAVSTTPYNTNEIPANTSILTAVNTPITTQITTIGGTPAPTLYSTPILTQFSTIQTTPISTLRTTQVSTLFPTQIATFVTTSVDTTIFTSIPTSVFPTTFITTNTTTQITTAQPTQVTTSSGTRLTVIFTPRLTGSIPTLGQTAILTTLFTSPPTLLPTSSTTQIPTSGQTPSLTPTSTFPPTLISTSGFTPSATVGSTPVTTFASTPILTNTTTLLSTQITTSVSTLLPGDPIVPNTPPSQIYSVCEVKNIGTNKFIISTQGVLRVITLTSDTTYSLGTQLSSSIVPLAGTTELLKTAWDSISNEYVELGWDSVNSLSKISRYSVSGTTIAAQDTTTLTSTQIPNSIGNVINMGQRKYIWNDYDKVYQITHNGSSFSVSASPLSLGVIGTNNFNTTLIRDNTTNGFMVGYFSNETTSSYNKIVNYLYDNAVTGGTESNSFSLLSSQFSNNTAINYLDMISFEDNVFLSVYEHGSVLYANVVTLKSY